MHIVTASSDPSGLADDLGVWIDRLKKSEKALRDAITIGDKDLIKEIREEKAHIEDQIKIINKRGGPALPAPTREFARKL